MRVITLLPSATEIVCALGVDPVGVSHECDHPPRVTDLPSVNRSRVDPEASTEEITRQVVEAEGGGVYEMDVETLARLDPDLIVTQGVCEVCAVDSVLVEEAVERAALDCEILTTDPHSLADVLDDVERVGQALDRETEAAALIGDLRERIVAVGDRVPGTPPAETAGDSGVRPEAVGAVPGNPVDAAGDDRATFDERPRVTVLDWTAPPMVAGHWIPGMVEFLGGEYGLSARGSASEVREWAEVREYDPECLVAAPCGFPVEQTHENLSDLVERPGWDDLAAVRNDQVYVMDGHDYCDRPGPRLVDTLEHLAWVLYPDRFERPPETAVVPVETLARQADAD